MKSNINDVAKHAGVSIKTVSRVMNNEPSVRQATRDKVMLSVNALNYQPNSAARNLAATKSYTIAFIYDNPNAYYVIDMQQGILSECRKQGYDLLIHPCDSLAEGIVENLSTMIRHAQIAGVVLTPPFSEMPEFIDELTKHDIKFVRILSGNEIPDQRSPCVMVDDYAAAFEITEHLIKLGHKHISFISGGKSHKSTSERLKGYKAALTANQIPLDPQYIVDGEYSFESGVQGAQYLLNLPNRPTAIFSCNDEIAAGALFASRLMNVDIPQQLSIVGFENSPFSRQTWPKLTTANQPNDQIAQNATKMLIAATRKQKEQTVNGLFVPELLIRDSSAKHV
ncbi:LacI family DNA-binding transcriptional regulator [Psychrobium sp. 1_MG-2023]|uniref:LacI family DNA-binding transcriptional regulator n=1 Tax=Psychrobium sp. 1_MG-2023 TaxID=3062624 RepID=UPI000C33B418|nr:LacI family DNA-binding transcriptional regulator [Psychrobium sp. 1_MG-2023]MDP2559528.1 LacI family DNA-binding transcriptional regulator [Psychrobium sp. 1_MG-2023]PKF59368.1 LacI family transcriptional regulator [Alteromonadales bacterium alter-6D02]